MSKRIYLTVALEPRKLGGIMAIVADHGHDLPSKDNPDIRVAKIGDSSAEKVALMVGAAMINAMIRAGFDLGEREDDAEIGPKGPEGEDGHDDSWN